jgi:hypothetical protein
MAQLPPGNAPGLPYNSLQTGTVIAFAITYGFCTLFLALRYIQAVTLVKKVELDLSKTACRGTAMKRKSTVKLIRTTQSSSRFLMAPPWSTLLRWSLVSPSTIPHATSRFTCRVKELTWTRESVMRHGWGRHLTELNMTDLMLFNEALLPNTLTYLITPAVTKMAILVVLFKINPSIVYRVCVVAIGVAIFSYTLVLTTITGGPCSPLKEGTLSCLMNVALAQAVLNIASDLAVVAAPIPTILGLQLSKKQKATVSCILALGSGYVSSFFQPHNLS